MLKIPLFDKVRLVSILILAILYGFYVFPLQMTVISIVGIVSYVLFITFAKKDMVDGSRRQRREEALRAVKVFLNDYQDIWKNQRLSNEKCYLTLGADGVSIRGTEKNPDADFYRVFKVIKSNVHTMEDVWNLFCKNFSYNKTYDGLIEDCKLYGLVVEEKVMENAVKRGDVNLLKPLTSQTEFKKVDINNASQEELTNLSGISVIMAKKAIKHRNDIGGFKSVEEFFVYLNIKPAMADKLKQILFVSEMKGYKKIEHYNERNVDL